MLKKSLLLLTASLVTITWQGCVDHKLPGPIECSDNPLVLELVSVQDSECASNNGSIEVRATGGTGDYLFQIGHSPAQAASFFPDLGAGVYEVSAEDASNCSAILEVVVKNEGGLSITFQTTEAGCGTSNGSIIVTPFDGVAPYTYRINGSPFSSDSTFHGLVAGDQSIIVRDDTGCEISQTVKVKSGVSYSTSVSSIIQTNCAISGCHNGSQFPDFRVFKNIQDNAAQIKTLTGNRTMPEEGSLTQAEINLIACWVDDGVPNN